MAKRKHAAALFEVFHNSNKPVSSSNSSSRGYGWWFKGRGQQAEPEDEPQAYDANDPTTMTIRSPLLAPRIAAVEAMEAPVAPKPAPVAKPAPVPKPVAASKPAAQVELADPMEALRQRLASVESETEAEPSPYRFQIDRGSRAVSFRLPLNTAVIATFGLFLVVGVAYVIGRHVGNSEAVAAQALADENRIPEVRPSALDIPRHASHPTPPAAPIAARPAPRIADESHYRDHDSGPIANSNKPLSIPKPVAASSGNEPRIIGLNYLLVQSYPNQATASEARDFLAQNGIACTVEKVPAGYYCPDPAWMSVITTRGFEREDLHSSEYEAFKKQIEKLGDKFAGNGKFKRFSIQVYKLK